MYWEALGRRIPALKSGCGCEGALSDCTLVGPKFLTDGKFRLLTTRLWHSLGAVPVQWYALSHPGATETAARTTSIPLENRQFGFWVELSAINGVAAPVTTSYCNHWVQFIFLVGHPVSS
jgi:hypothetical protein